MKQIAVHICAIVRVRVLYHWFCHIRRKPELFIPVLERERRELGL